MAWTVNDMPDLTGRTALVTGANSGIGLVTATELARHGAHVVLACRNIEAGEQAARGMSGEPRVVRLDLASLDSVHALADDWQGPLDLLVNNAGVMMPPAHRRTADGFELQFGTNHLGHFALTGLLLPALLRAQAPRVATVSSIAHFNGNRLVLQGNPDEDYSARVSYSQSKLANLLFAQELDRRARAAGTRLVSAAAHPGFAATNLIDSPDGSGGKLVLRLASRLMAQPAAAGALPILYASTVAEAGSYSGPQHLRGVRGPVGPAAMSSYASDRELARELWDLSEEWTGVTFAWPTG